MKQMHTPDDVKDDYIHHLALFVRNTCICHITPFLFVFMQRKFVREVNTETLATYKNFRSWLDNSSPTDEMWESIMAEDEQHDYCTPCALQDETHPHIESEVNVYTSSGISHDGNGSEVEESDGEGA